MSLIKTKCLLVFKQLLTFLCVLFHWVLVNLASL
jgi:hypothetical protein